jgi:hypothetical protein
MANGGAKFFDPGCSVPGIVAGIGLPDSTPLVPIRHKTTTNQPPVGMPLELPKN